MTSRAPLLLPVRPRRRIDEWSETYLVEAARANGLSRPWRNHLELVRAALPGEVTGPELPVRYASSLKDGTPLYGGLLVPARSRVGRAGVLRYCPECFADEPYIRARWRIVGYHVCGEHGCLLKDDLVEPAYTATYKTSGKTYYGCASTESVWTGAACALPAGLNIHGRVWSAFELLDRTYGPASAETAHELGWALLLQRLVDVASGSNRGCIGDSSPPGAVARRGAWADEFCPDIESGWTGFLKLLNALPNVRVKRNVRRVLSAYLAAEEKGKSIFSLLPLSDMLARLDGATPELGGVTKAWSISLADVKSKCLSVHEASLEIGVPIPRFEAFVREHEIPPAHSVRTERKTHRYFTREQVRAVKRHFMALVAVEELVETAGLSWPGYFSLRKAGYLRPLIEGGRRFAFRSEVNALLTRLDDCSSPTSGARRPLISLFGTEVFSQGVPQGVSKGLVDGVLSGSISVFRDLSETGFAAFKVCDTIAVRRDQLRLVSSSSRRQEAAQVQGQLELFA